jgi:hypothetical protein
VDEGGCVAGVLSIEVIGQTLNADQQHVPTGADSALA